MGLWGRKSMDSEGVDFDDDTLTDAEQATLFQASVDRHQLPQQYPVHQSRSVVNRNPTLTPSSDLSVENMLSAKTAPTEPSLAKTPIKRTSSSNLIKRFSMSMGHLSPQKRGQKTSAFSSTDKLADTLNVKHVDLRRGKNFTVGSTSSPSSESSPSTSVHQLNPPDIKSSDTGSISSSHGGSTSISSPSIEDVSFIHQASKGKLKLQPISDMPLQKSMETSFSPSFNSDIFERSVSTQPVSSEPSPFDKIEDYIPPVLDATTEAILDHSIDPNEIEVLSVTSASPVRRRSSLAHESLARRSSNAAAHLQDPGSPKSSVVPSFKDKRVLSFCSFHELCATEVDESAEQIRTMPLGRVIRGGSD